MSLKTIYMPIRSQTCQPSCAGSDWKDSEWALPKCSTWVYGLGYAEDNGGPKDSGRAFYLPLNCLKEFRSMAWPRKRTITREDRSDTRGTASWSLCAESSLCPLTLHGLANICLPNTCSSHLLVNCLSSLWSPRPLFNSSQLNWEELSRRHRSLNCLRVVGSPSLSLSLWDSSTYALKLVFLSLICLMSIYCTN